MGEVCILDSFLNSRETRDQNEKSTTLRIDSMPSWLTRLTKGNNEESRKLTCWLNCVLPERNRRLAATKSREMLLTTTRVGGANE